MGKYLALAWVVVIGIALIESKSTGTPLGIGAVGIVVLLIVSLVYFVIRLFRKNKTVSIQEDSWERIYKEFLHVFYFWIFLLVVLIALLITKRMAIAQLGPIGIAEFFLFGIVWFSLVRLFKNRNKRAIGIAYVSLCTLFVLSLIDSVQLATFLIYGYFLYRVYRASRILDKPVAQDQLMR